MAGPPDDLAAIANLVEKLEAAPNSPAIRLAVIPVESTRAELLAPRVQTLMRQRQQSLGRTGLPSDRVTIEPDPASNSLIVAASEENLRAIGDLIEALQRAETESAGGVIEIVQLMSSSAEDIVDLLEDLYVEEANRKRGPDTVRVMPDERLNAVVVNAPRNDVRAIKRLNH